MSTEDIHPDDAVAAALFAPGLSPGRRRELAEMQPIHHYNCDIVDCTPDNIAYWMSHESATHPPHGGGHPYSLARTDAEYEKGGMPSEYYLACRLPVVGAAEAMRDLRAVRWGVCDMYGVVCLAEFYHTDPREYDLLDTKIMALENLEASWLRGDSRIVVRWAERAHRRVRRYLAWAHAARAAAALRLGRRGPRAAAIAGAARCACCT